MDNISAKDYLKRFLNFVFFIYTLV